MAIENKVLESLKKGFDKIIECQRQGHPYSQTILRPYHPGSNGVLVQCSGCEDIYARSPTSEEISSFNDALRIQVTI